MFTGIIEDVGRVVKVTKDGYNLDLWIKCDFVDEIRIDQSISHNGVCLTVVDIRDELYKVTAVKETLEKSNLRETETNSKINLERCLKIGDRIDGHIVQGHVDCTATCIDKINVDGSWLYKYEYPKQYKKYLIPKGSISVNGVSLTVIDPIANQFSITIIPYTFHHTTFCTQAVHDIVNIEFDVFGKYINRHLELQNDTDIINGDQD